MTIWLNESPDISRLNSLGSQTLVENLGIEFSAVGPDWIAAEMEVDRRTVQPWGRLHGGASIALAETAASMGAALTIDPKTHAAVGLEINANHVRAASEGKVTAIARLEYRGRSTQIWSFRVSDYNDRLVCLGRITIAIIEAGGARTQKNAQPPQAEPTPERKSVFRQYIEEMASLVA